MSAVCILVALLGTIEGFQKSDHFSTRKLAQFLKGAHAIKLGSHPGSLQEELFQLNSWSVY